VNGFEVRDGGPAADQHLARALFDPAARSDPYPLYASVDIPGRRHAAAEAILKDPRIGPPTRQSGEEPLWSCFARWLINLDGSRHLAVRRLFSGIFTARRVERYREGITRKANSLLDAVQDRGRMDLVSEFARPLPFSIICDVLGVPAAGVVCATVGTWA
jgi:pimeloyl-[acyl-carrier protein] synthase